MFDSMERIVSNETPGTSYGIDRRTFLSIVTQAVAAIGLSASAAVSIAEAAARGKRPSVIWLHFQDCTGCTESLLRTTQPGLAEVVLDLISLDYHETLLAAAGHQADAALKQAMRTNAGKYVCIVEGAIPTRDQGVYCMIGGRTAIEILTDVASEAGAIIAIGSCATGGVPSASPNPTGSVGAHEILKGKTVVNIPGCPANPYNLLGTVLQFATYGTLPALDRQQRPLFAYADTIHEHCPRRAHFDAGRFADVFGDEGHRKGYCLYKLGCKGPVTHANCSVQHFCDVDGAWPIGLGHPCFGCTEQNIAFTMPLHATVTIDRPMPPDTYAPIRAAQGRVSPVATAVGGAIVGAAAAAGYVASKKLSSAPEEERPESHTEV